MGDPLFHLLLEIKQLQNGPVTKAQLEAAVEKALKAKVSADAFDAVVKSWDMESLDES